LVAGKLLFTDRDIEKYLENTRSWLQDQKQPWIKSGNIKQKAVNSFGMACFEIGILNKNRTLTIKYQSKGCKCIRALKYAI
jgi:hypothetical protein